MSNSQRTMRILKRCIMASVGQTLGAISTKNQDPEVSMWHVTKAAPRPAAYQTYGNIVCPLNWLSYLQRSHNSPNPEIQCSF